MSEPEHVARFLTPIRRRNGEINIGAAVNERGQIVIVLPGDGAPPLSVHEATELQKMIREAVIDAALRRD